MTYECDVCGLEAPEWARPHPPSLWFEHTGNVTHCPTCDPAKAPFIIRNDGPAGAGWTE